MTEIPHNPDAPRILILPDKKLLAIHTEANGDLKLREPQGAGEAHVTGLFAQNIRHLLHGNEREISRSYLRAIEGRFPWLRGLSTASAGPQNGLDLLLGEGLGMLFIELTSRCNERCIHCYADSSPERSDFLTLAEVKQTLAEARTLGRPRVQFTGGDPLIHRDLTAAVSHARQLDFESVEIYTNGLLLDRAMIEALQPLQPDMAFSLYSHQSETHDLITRLPGSHAKTVRAIRAVLDAGLNVRVSIIRMPENSGQEEEICRFLHDELHLAPAQIQFGASHSVGRGRLFTPPASAAGDRPETTEADGRQPQQSRRTAVATAHADPRSESGGRRGKLCISANGDILPCVFSRDIRLGNIRHAPLTEALQPLKARRLAAPLTQRWMSCRERLECGDCQLISYLLGEEAVE